MSVLLKPLTTKYLPQYLQMLNDPEVRKMTQPYEEFRAFSEGEVRSWLEKIPLLPDRKDFAIVRESDGVFLGEIVINEVKDGAANIRLAIGQAYWGQGYGTSALTAALNFGFQSMDLKEIKLSVFNINDRGLNLYKKMGFQVAGQDEFEGFPETLMAISRDAWIARP